MFSSSPLRHENPDYLSTTTWVNVWTLEPSNDAEARVDQIVENMSGYRSVRQARVFGTGQPVIGDHLGSAVDRKTFSVWHVFTIRSSVVRDE